ncbi:MAG TPA: nitronate monooxygenase, partial [Thermoanaerobaculia bacterium]|nr:nitronate monooxygenase [Thermoanaerobaculia bacterium]
DEMAQPPAELLPYPHQNELTRELRYAAARAGRDDLLPFYGGQSTPLATLGSAADLVRTLAEETEAAFESVK